MGGYNSMNQPAASVRDEQKKDSFGAKLAKLLSDFSVHYMWEKKWFFLIVVSYRHLKKKRW